MIGTLNGSGTRWLTRRLAALENRDQARRRRQVERLFLRDFIIGNTEKREVDVGIVKVRPSTAQLKSADISVVVFVPGVLDQLKVVGLQLLKSVETRIEYLVQVIDLVVLVHEPRCEKAVYDQSPPSARPFNVAARRRSV